MDTIEKCIFNLLICMWIAISLTGTGAIVYTLIVYGTGEQGKFNQTAWDKSYSGGK